MRDELTLRQISQHILAELFNARTDFLLRQTAFWHEINARTTDPTAYAHPDSLDVTGSQVEFYIRPRPVCLLLKLIPATWRKTRKGIRFRLSDKNRNDAIHVMISINIAGGKELKADITTDPETGLKPEEIHVAGIA
jgi:hypothetical protein